MKIEERMKEIMKKAVMIFLSVVIFAGLGWAIRITVTGSWTEVIDVNDLQSGAGSDLVSSYESSSTQIDIDITDVTPSYRWSVYIKRVDSSWHSNLTLYTRRTSSHTYVLGGTSYQEVTTSDQQFFYTERRNYEVYDIKVQLQVTGVSVQIPPGTYTTTIYYTITEYI